RHAALPRRSEGGLRVASGAERHLDDARPDDRDPHGRVLVQPARRGGAKRARPEGTRLMWPYIVRRLLSGLVMLFAVTLMTFAVFRLIPFTPACIIVPCGPGTTTTDAQIRAAEHKLGTDRPVPVQYAKFVWGIFRHGTFGRSWRTGGSVDQSLRAALPRTISVLLGGIVVLLLLAIPLAALSALRAQTVVDRAILLFAILGIALHPLLLGVGLTNVFAGYLHVLPFGSYCHLLPVKPHPPPTTFTGPPGSTALEPECGGPLVWAQDLVL